MITVSGAHKRYGRTVALDGVHLHAPRGAVTAVVGPNGAGKSTLLRAVLGLERLDAGAAHVDGRPFAHTRAPLRTVGAAIDATALHPGRRVVDEVRIAAAANRLPRRAVDAALDEVGLGGVARRRVRALSLGMRQRLGLALALVGDPAALVLDEPLNGLDVDGIRWVRALLRERADAGCAVLLSSHVLAEVERVSDSVHVLVAGRTVAASELADGGARPAHVVAVSDDPPALARLVTRAGGTATREGRALLIDGLPLRAVAELVHRERFFVESLAQSADTLEDDYLRLVAETREPALPAAGSTS